MARRIYQRDSTNLHLKAVRRHIRLANKQIGAEKFAIRILPYQQTLTEKHQLTETADEKREDAYDDIQLADRSLDDTIRTTFETCEQYDRKNPGANILLKIFPRGTFSDIVNMPYAKEPVAAERIASSLEALGKEHLLYPLAATLRADITRVNTFLDAYKLSVTELTHAEVEEETAKASLRQQYEYNYLDGRKELGVKLVENIFPVLNTRVKESEEDKPVPATNVE